MRHFYSIVTAAAAVIASLVRLSLSDENQSAPGDSDQASPIPRITARLVEQMAYTGATDREIADRFLVGDLELTRRYADTLRVARALRHMALRSLQFDLARKLNASVLTWLGRNELGQSLNPSVSGEPIPELHEDEFSN